jgi:hypothetical protein
MEPEGSLTCSQKLTTGPCPEPGEYIEVCAKITDLYSAEYRFVFLQ